MNARINVNDLIDAVGGLMLGMLEEPWERLSMRVTKENNVTDSEAWVEAEARETEWISLFDHLSDDERDELDDAVDELWNRFEKAGTPWRTATFVVTSGGEAKVNFGYRD